MDILDFFLDILLKPPQPLMGLFLYTICPELVGVELGCACSCPTKTKWISNQTLIANTAVQLSTRILFTMLFCLQTPQ